VIEAVPPIVIDDHGALEVYPSVAMACADLEVVDVNDGAFEAFDSLGRHLLLTTHDGHISIDVPRVSNPNPEELERRLRFSIRRLGIGRVGVESLDDTPLSLMLAAMLRFQRREGR
jgi:hypothetical protein